MSVPEFQAFMLPVLQTCRDGKEHHVREIMDLVAKQMNISSDDRRERLPSGRATKFDNRVLWASTYLRKAGLLESVARGKVKITANGLKVLDKKPARIDTKYLSQFDKFRDFTEADHSESKDSPEEAGDKTLDSDLTPAEALERTYSFLSSELARDLLEYVKNGSPRFFEELVVELLVAMGYGGSMQDAQAVGRSGDGGIDGVIKEDKLGLDVVYVQAKRWQNSVGRPIIQGFAGSLDGVRARKGVFITTSSFTNDAREYVNKIDKKIVLIDGEQLAQLMLEHGIGVSEVNRYVIHKIDVDYFEE